MPSLNVNFHDLCFLTCQYMRKCVVPGYGKVGFVMVYFLYQVVQLSGMLAFSCTSSIFVVMLFLNCVLVEMKMNMN